MSVQKAAGNIELFTVGGSTVETHDAVGITQVHTLFPTSMTVVLSDGTPASNAFTTFARAKAASMTINLVTGAWTTTAGTSGTLSNGQLNPLNANQRTLRNSLENIANAIGLVPGTLVAWT